MNVTIASVFSSRNSSSRICLSALHPFMRDDAGQGLTELALTLPLFLLLILGMAEIANVAWSAIQVENAARAGAQFGSQSRAAAADTTDIANAAKNDAPSLAAIASPNGLAVTSSQSCQCIDASTGATAGTGCTTVTQCPSPNVIMDYVQVNTTVTVAPFMRYPHLPATYTLKGQAILGVVK